ncbi:MAG: hypothetical protein D8M57_15880 [Candidatus Scalindua sp. AMX11]|nr:MAG: hypothetical protein DWQ00_08415 [Candidatus Scalindua sp.]NOG84927.1 hypothetical protein [Planctomycetota bacterium]RZV84989.1 MAG: hypothetical protein EX341_08275 [Candidatus Scalindua sp. SCAELEC01]TDE63921.1 MAG: hypothetical protein D8M57_15880 [Candidatus Scalindua sp. AMX11]GJQ60701.1 MAG: hypothetical protein SCALA701_35020 [Candidatus Scalindua sp.]
MQTTNNLKPIEYRIDSRSIITFVSKNWSEFARENGANNLTDENTIGKRLKEFIAGNETYELYINIIDKVKNTGKEVVFPFRCDSPDCRRFMHMTVAPYTINEIQFKSVMVKKELREVQSLLSLETDRSDEFLTICSWYKKIKITDKLWQEIEEGIKALKLMEEINLPKLTHGICPECLQKVTRQMKYFRKYSN